LHINCDSSTFVKLIFTIITVVDTELYLTIMQFNKTSIYIVIPINTINNCIPQTTILIIKLFKRHFISLQIMKRLFIIDFSVFNKSWKDTEILDKFSTNYKILLALDLNAWMSLLNKYSYKIIRSLRILKDSKSLLLRHLN